MPIKKSSVKDVRRITTRTESNKAARSKVRTLKKAVTVATTKEQGQEALKTAVSALDKAAKTNLIHKNKASRLKSRLTKKVNKLV